MKSTNTRIAIPTTVALLASLFVAGFPGALPANGGYEFIETGADAESNADAEAKKDYAKLPIAFERNVGQAPEKVEFLARGGGYTLWLTEHRAVLNLAGKTPEIMSMGLAGSPGSQAITGQKPLEAKVNYLLGDDPAGWQTDVPTFSQVSYNEVYPGIDLVFYGRGGALEYDFVVAPGADPADIELRIGGADELALNAAGELDVGLGAQTITQSAPILYQGAGNAKSEVEGAFELLGTDRIGFSVGSYDALRTLVIDPTLTYSTYLGGSSDFDDKGQDVDVDSDGSAYVTGHTHSADFPTTTGAWDVAASPADVFVSKLNPAGTALEYSTFVGGSDNDRGFGIAVESEFAYVTGHTVSTDFPVSATAFQPGLKGAGNGRNDAFVLKLATAGDAIAYSTYLGGTSFEEAYEVAVLGGSAYVTGYTGSSESPTPSNGFPTTAGAMQTTYGGDNRDAFVSKLNASGSGLDYSTYLGGSGSDTGRGVAVDSDGSAYVTGVNSSVNFPTTAGAMQTTHGGDCCDAFVSKLNPAGSGLTYSTYLGGTGNDEGNGVAVLSGSAYVTGITASSNFPTTTGALDTSLSGNNDAFVSKLALDGSSLVYSTFLGSTGNEFGEAVAVDSSGSAYVTGATYSGSFPTVSPVQATSGGDTDAFVSKFLPDGSGLVYSTHLGGAGSDVGFGIAVDSDGSAYIMGTTNSANFPTAAPPPGPVQATYEGGNDAFVSKISPVSRLTVAKAGTGFGTITSSPAGISCPSDCTEDFTDGTIVDLTATPDAGSRFDGWSGACSGTGACQVTMSQARSVTATFIKVWTLTAATTGSGAGTVTSNPAGINCGVDCTEPYDTGTIVDLTATPTAGSQFGGWSGACSGTGACQVTMDQARSVTATFIKLWTLTAATTPSGAGTVTSSPVGISCPSDCAEDFTDGTIVDLTNTPPAGSRFDGWTGDCTGSGACQVTMNQARSVTATFIKVRTMTFKTSKDTIVFGDNVKLSGTVTSSDNACKSGVAVGITPTPGGALQATTNASGVYSLFHKPKEKTSYTASIAEGGGCEDAGSGPKVVKVGKKVTLHASETRVKKDTKITLTAQLAPCAGKQGQDMTLKVKTRGPYSNVGTKKVNENCKASWTEKITKNVTFQAVSPKQDPKHEGGTSSSVKVTLK